MTATDGVAGVFDRAADTYDDVGVPWFGPIAAGLVEQLAVQPGERVLDVGCGRGAVLEPLARASGPTGQAVGIDLAPRMVERTARDLAHLPQVRVQPGDASAPDLPPASFDVVSASLVLFFLPDPVAALRAWRGLLAPGGRVGVTTFGAQDERWRLIDELFVPYLPPTMLDARTTGRRGPYASDDGVELLLRDAGFTDVRTVSSHVDAVFRDAEHWLEFSWSHGQRAMWEAVAPERRPALREQIIALVSPMGDESGAFVLTQQVRYTLGRRDSIRHAPRKRSSTRPAS